VRTQGHDLVVGAVANIAVVDPSAVRVISATDLASRSRNTPYDGMELPGRVVHTVFAGTPTVLDGALV
jgi:dihydroorotase